MPTKTQKQRIAVLFPEQVYPGKVGATRMLLDLTHILLSRGYGAKVFSLGSEPKEISEGKYEESVVHSKISSDSRTGAARALDYLCLTAFGKQYSYYIMNNSKELEEALDEYAPGCLITVGRALTDFIIRYKETHDLLCLTVTDDFRVVENSLQIRMDEASKANPIKRALVSFASSRFREFSWTVYSRMVDGLDAVVLLTEADRKFALSRFKGMSGKFFVMPTASCPPGNVLKRAVNKTSKKIDNILFIGNARHEPNLQAMEIIEQKIAPRLKDKHFIIVGSGMSAHGSGNVEYMGFVSEKEKFAIIDEADLCIAPLLKGSGIKIKMLDYFMLRPVLATSLAFEGYEVKNDVNGVVENDPDRYVSQIMRLERSPELRARLGANASKLCDYYSYSNVGSKWDSLLAKLA